MISKVISTKNPTISLDKLSGRQKIFLKSIAKQLITGYYANGTITDKDLNLPAEAFFDKIRAITDRSEFDFVIDHRDRILNEAVYFYEKKEYALAKIMYAMFFEHSINELIINYCIKKRFDEGTRIEIIKSISIHGKLSWLLKVFEFPIFNEAHKKIIKKVAEDRNAFVHYKWKIKEENDANPNIHADEFKKIKRATIYMKSYETKVKFNKNKKHLTNRLKLK